MWDLGSCLQTGFRLEILSYGAYKVDPRWDIIDHLAQSSFCYVRKVTGKSTGPENPPSLSKSTFFYLPAHLTVSSLEQHRLTLPYIEVASDIIPLSLCLVISIRRFWFHFYKMRGWLSRTPRSKNPEAPMIDDNTPFKESDLFYSKRFY